MRKNILTISICGVLVASSIYFYFYLYNFKDYKDNYTIKAIPTDASVILQIDNPAELSNTIINKINYSEDLKEFNWYSRFYHSICEMDSSKTFSLNEISKFRNRQLTISLHKEGKENVISLFLLKLKNKAEQNSIENFLTQDSNPIGRITKRKYNSNTIYTLIDNTNKNEYYLAIYNGITIISKSSILVEKSLRQLETEYSFLKNTTFNKLYKTAGNNSDINVFVNFKNLPEAIKPLFIDNFKEKLSVLSKFGEWGEFDINLNRNVININGFIHPSKENNDYNLLFDGIDASSTQIAKVIPDNSNLFISYNFEDEEDLKQNFTKFLNKTNTYNQYLSQYTKTYHNLPINESENIIFDLLDNEFALVFNPSNPNDINDGQYLILKTNSKSKTLKALTRFNNKVDFEPIYNYKLDNKTNFPIYDGHSLKIFEYVFYNFFSISPTKYFTFYDNYLIFSNSVSSLKSFIYANVLKKTIYNNKYYQRFSENFSYKENVFVFCDFSKFQDIFPEVSNFNLFNPDKEQKQNLSKFYGVGLQGSKANDLMYINTSIEYLPVREKEPQTVWQSRLDSTIISKPSLVENHYTKEKEIIVQDKSNIIYLIANNGKVLWEKKLDSPILSEIFQIDYYRNSKLQYLFNTKNKIFLIDRNGNAVDNYPINLANQATNGIALFDYDNNRNYRIFVACNNQQTYAFDKSGKIITGWKFNKTEGKVSKPIQHFRIANKDYIVLSDNKRNYILNRKGKNRINIKGDFISNPNSIFYSQVTDHPFIVNTDLKGNIIEINLNNGKTTKLLKNDVGDHYFTVSNITQNKNDEYIILTKDNLTLYSNSGKKIFKTGFSGEIVPVADLYQFTSSNKKIGVFDSLNNKIYLINNDGSLYKNFPLKGKSRFSIGFLSSTSNHFNLIVGGDNNYLYNYSIE